MLDSQLVLAKVSALRNVAVYSPDHKSCSPLMLRAWDEAGNVWVGHAHLQAPWSDSVGQSGRAFSELSKAVDYLRSHGFLRIQARLAGRAGGSRGLPKEDTLSAWMIQHDVELLATESYPRKAVLNTLNTAEWSVIDSIPGSDRSMKPDPWPPPNPAAIVSDDSPGLSAEPHQALTDTQSLHEPASPATIPATAPARIWYLIRSGVDGFCYFPTAAMKSVLVSIGFLRSAIPEAYMEQYRPDSASIQGLFDFLKHPLPDRGRLDIANGPFYNEY